MSDSKNQHQVDIFASDHRQRYYAELCNALYERELLSLSQSAPNNVSLMQRRLAGLSYHIKNAAEHLLDHDAPIKVDIHNASWQAKQTTKSVVTRHDKEKCFAWYHANLRMGLPAPIYVSDMGLEQVELDSVDRIDTDNQRVHVNKHGWFDLHGHPEGSPLHAHHKRLLLLPNKVNMVAACCGHSWNHKGKTLPRALSLRELLLSTTINWKTFK